MDGITALTNTGFLHFDAVVMSSNSPQATLIASALNLSRMISPNGHFRDVGDILATPQLSEASPWLNQSGGTGSGITDEAYEKIPSQLLPLLRPDSVGTIIPSSGELTIRFTGIDTWQYVTEVSSNLLDWVAVSTNSPTNGVFEFVELPGDVIPHRFYRTMLLP